MTYNLSILIIDQFTIIAIMYIFEGHNYFGYNNIHCEKNVEYKMLSTSIIIIIRIPDC